MAAPQRDMTPAGLLSRGFAPVKEEYTGKPPRDVDSVYTKICKPKEGESATAKPAGEESLVQQKSKRQQKRVRPFDAKNINMSGQPWLKTAQSNSPKGLPCPLGHTHATLPAPISSPCAGAASRKEDTGPVQQPHRQRHLLFW